MFHVPTALENLQNKEQQYQAAVKAFNQANTYLEIIKWAIFKEKQYHQYRESLYQYESESREREKVAL